MLSKGIKDFLDEIGRLDYHDIDSLPFDDETELANGIKEVEGIEVYTRKINALYGVFKDQIKTLAFMKWLKSRTIFKTQF